MSTAANRYAEALLRLAISGNAVDEYQNELTAVSQVYQADNGLKSFLLCPQKDLSAKKDLLHHAFSRSVNRDILHLLFLLLEKGRMKSLPEISSAYVKMADDYRNIVDITVLSALPLSRAQLDGIAQKFQTMYHGSSVKITVKTDPALIGGVKVTVGDKLYDGTVKGKLSKMQSAVAGQ